MRAWVKEGKPVYGTCAGLILLSEVEAQRVGGQQLLGGINITSKRNRWGRQSESFICLLDAPAINKGDERKPAQALFIRAPGIVRVGEGVEVIAYIPADVIAEHEKNIGGRGVGVFVGHLEEHWALQATTSHPS
jgi:5'-phosphate synthase pdxT subunit